MNGFHFFAEMPAERKSKAASKTWPFPFTRKWLQHQMTHGRYANVAAVFTGLEHTRGDRVECISSVYDWEDSDVATSSVSRDYLRKRCVRVSETLARQLHPQLFRRLDEPQ